jgi:hypothetical protein
VNRAGRRGGQLSQNDAAVQNIYGPRYMNNAGRR